MFSIADSGAELLGLGLAKDTVSYWGPVSLHPLQTNGKQGKKNWGTGRYMKKNKKYNGDDSYVEPFSLNFLCKKK